MVLHVREPVLLNAAQLAQGGYRTKTVVDIMAADRDITGHAFQGISASGNARLHNGDVYNSR